ncbi:MAG: cobalamin biosynthesis protein [Actinoplanes sp.]
MVLGLGARSGVPQEELAEAVDAALAAAGLHPTAIAVLATLDRRAADSAIIALARRYGWQLVDFPATDLAAVAVPNPSPVVAAAVRTAGVAEAAALLAAGPEARLILTKRAYPRVTIAIARGARLA